jgi:hypothetical protein
VEQTGWPEYLDALEGYLQHVSRLLEHKSVSVVPCLRASQPRVGVPPEHLERAVGLLDETRRVEDLIAMWINEVISSMRSVETRRRIEPCRPSGIVNSVL